MLAIECSFLGHAASPVGELGRSTTSSSALGRAMIRKRVLALIGPRRLTA